MSETDNINDSSNEPEDVTTGEAQPEVGAMSLHLIERHLDRIASIKDTNVIGGITVTTEVRLRGRDE